MNILNKFTKAFLLLLFKLLYSAAFFIDTFSERIGIYDLFHLSTALNREDKAFGNNSRAQKLAPSVRHIGWNRIEYRASVSVSFQYREFKAPSVGKHRLAALAGLARAKLTSDALLGYHKRKSAVNADRALAANIAYLSQGKLGR